MGGENMNNQKQENLKQLFKEAFQQVTTDPESFMQFLNQIKLLHKYDLTSQLFIHGQKPHASYIADFDTWKSLGRYVKKGEKAITVLHREQNRMIISHFFDVSQTVGKEIRFPDYTFNDEKWALFFSQEIQDQIDEQIDLNADPIIRRLSIDLGVSLAKSKSLGVEIPKIKDTELTQLQNFSLFVEILTNANKINQFLSKEILVYKKEREREDELRILRERDRTIDSENRVSRQRTTREIWENSRRQASGRKSSGISNQVDGRRTNEVGTRDRQEGMGQSNRIDGSSGESQSINASSTSELRRKSEDSITISGTSNRTRNERDSIDGNFNSDIKDLEEKQSSESFFVEKNPDYEEITPDFTEEELNNILRRGSGIEGGKIRIYHLYQQTLSKKERVSFLKEEYGWSGSTLDIQGSSFSMMDCRPGKGITVIKKINNEDYERVMKWSEVEERIGLLIRQNEYLTEEELKLVQSKKEESVKEALSQMDTEAEELTLFDLEEIETEEKPVVTEGYGTEVAFIPKIEAKKEIINHGETIFEQIYRNKTNGFLLKI